MADMGLDPMDVKIFVEGEVGVGKGEPPHADERSKSSIAKRVRTLPRPRNPSVVQSSPYLHSNRALGKDKRKFANVYTSYKWLKKHGSVLAAPEKVKLGTYICACLDELLLLEGVV